MGKLFKLVSLPLPSPPFYFVLFVTSECNFSCLWQMNNNYNLDHSEIRKIAGLGNISAPACFATAGTALIVGFVPKC